MGSTRFMGWDGPILTDSGGYQVFSLAETRRISEEGVEFASVYDGSRHVFTPELTTRVQEDLGSDVAMVLDECPPAERAPRIPRGFPEKDGAVGGAVQGGARKRGPGALRHRAGWTVS